MDNFNVYVVFPKDGIPIPYDEFLSVTVVAKNEEDAINTARKEENEIWSFRHAFDDLKNSEINVKLIDLDKSKIISSSFLYG
jgi:hypothetical protein